jgi:ferredoxin
VSSSVVAEFEVTLHPIGSRVLIAEGAAVGPALKAQGISIHSGCAGDGYCADCIVTIVDQPGNAMPPTYDERRMIGALFHSPRYRDPQPTRLACQLRLRGPIGVDISRHLDARPEQKRETPEVLIPASQIARRSKP